MDPGHEYKNFNYSHDPRERPVQENQINIPGKKWYEYLWPWCCNHRLKKEIKIQGYYLEEWIEVYRVADRERECLRKRVVEKEALYQTAHAVMIKGINELKSVDKEKAKLSKDLELSRNETHCLRLKLNKIIDVFQGL